MMISWVRIIYGANLSAVLEVLLMLLVPKWRKPSLIATTAAIGLIAPFGWQAVLKSPTPESSSPICPSGSSRSAGKTPAAE